MAGQSPLHCTTVAHLSAPVGCLYTAPLSKSLLILLRLHAIPTVVVAWCSRRRRAPLSPLVPSSWHHCRVAPTSSIP